MWAGREGPGLESQLVTRHREKHFRALGVGLFICTLRPHRAFEDAVEIKFDNASRRFDRLMAHSKLSSINVVCPYISSSSVLHRPPPPLSFS